MSKVYVSQPGIHGCIHQNCLLTAQQMTRKHDWQWFFIENCSLITKGRNDAFSRFLASDFDYLLTLDADLVIGPPGCLDRMIDSCPAGGIIGGFYAMKALTPEGVPPVNGVPMDPKEQVTLDPWNPQDPDKKGRLIRLKYLPSGFMLISRQVAETMVQAHSKEVAFDDQDPRNGGIPMYAMYNTLIAEEGGKRHFLPEDFSFCHRATQAGIPIWGDCRVQLGHIGSYLYHLAHLVQQPQPASDNPRPGFRAHRQPIGLPKMPNWPPRRP